MIVFDYQTGTFLGAIPTTGGVINPGSLGIGGTPINDAFEVFSPWSSIYAGQAALFDSRALAAGNGGQLDFGAIYTGSSYTAFASVQGTKLSAVAGNLDGQLILRARSNATGMVNIITLDGNTNAGQIHGTNTNDDAATGYVGEYKTSGQFTPTNFATTNTYGNVNSISLTAGDGEVWGGINTTLNGAVCTQVIVAISLYPNDTRTDHTDGDNVFHQAPPLAANASSVCVPSWRVKVTTTTTVYLKGLAQYSAGNPQYVGRISARRQR